MTTSKNKVAILDGDSWVYRCGGAAEHTYYMVNYFDEALGNWVGYTVDDYRAGMKELKRLNNPAYQLWSRKEIEPLENCLQMVKTSLENTLDVLGTKDYRLYLGGRRNFRSDIYPDYKANRDSAPKPKYYRDIRDYLVGKWGGVVCEGIEADDAVATDATSLGPDVAIIVAVDKDLDQVPGVHYNWTEGKTYTVSAREGLTFFYEQMLTGDDIDNIPGIKGIGPAKAKRALAGCKSPKDMAKVVYDMHAAVWREDNPEGNEEAFRLFLDRNAHLLWIKRRKDDTHPFWKHYG